MSRKYRLCWPTEVTLPTGERKWLYRIKALKNIPEFGVKKGDLGGYISGGKVLSHEGICWIGGTAIVEERVQGDFAPRLSVRTKGKNMVSGNALITDQAYVVGSFIEDAQISGNARIRLSCIEGSAQVYGDAELERVSARGPVEISDNAWIHGAKLTGEIRVSGSVDIKGSAALSTNGFIVLQDNARLIGSTITAFEDSTIVISGNASIEKFGTSGSSLVAPERTEIGVSGNVVIAGSRIAGEFMAVDSVNISQSNIRGVTHLSGNVSVHPGANLSGITKLEADEILTVGEYVDGVLAPYQRELPEADAPAELLAIPAGSQRYASVINETLDEYASYTTDLIKLIKYPAMADASVVETQNLLVAIKRAKRALNYPEELDALKTASEAVEEAFVKAENRAKAIAAEYLDDKKKGSLKKAGHLISLACDEAATEQEKRSSVKATLHSLTGIFEISDEAIEKLKARVGIREIEA